MRSGLLLANIIPLAMASITSSSAKPYVLKCTVSDGRPVADLTVDLDALIMTWGGTRYVITDVTDRYISGMKTARDAVPPVGGEVWVLDRVTGEYKKAVIGMFYNDATYPSAPVLQAFTTSGKCVRPMF